MGRRSETDASLVLAWFQAHGPAILRYLTARVGPHHGEDLTAETFLTALRRLETFDPARGTPLAWLYGIATHLIHSHARHSSRRLQQLPDHARPAPSDTDLADDRVDASAVIRRLAPDLRALDPVDLNILLLISWAGLQPSEVARALGMPAATVRVRLHRTRRHLQHRHAVEREGQPR